MKCRRCQGLMVKDKVYDPDGQFLHLDIWRCINCGETVDPTILQARKEKQAKEEQQDPLYTKKAG
ncbi:MAG: hypothetical protein D6690_13520 [Nitrospirae bacterium]|nr:MAG: hypothetical protein D6690_13520 [Nitrospirota bacterium]